MTDVIVCVLVLLTGIALTLVARNADKMEPKNPYKAQQIRNWCRGIGFTLIFLSLFYYFFINGFIFRLFGFDPDRIKERIYDGVPDWPSYKYPRNFDPEYNSPGRRELSSKILRDIRLAGSL